MDCKKSEQDSDLVRKTTITEDIVERHGSISYDLMTLADSYSAFADRLLGSEPPEKASEKLSEPRNTELFRDKMDIVGDSLSSSVNKLRGILARLESFI